MFQHENIMCLQIDASQMQNQSCFFPHIITMRGSELFKGFINILGGKYVCKMLE